MPRYFALLRGINVGGHRIKMDRLRELVEALGFAQVETFIASGNVIFSAHSLDVRGMEERIAGHLEGALGYEVTTSPGRPRSLPTGLKRWGAFSDELAKHPGSSPTTRRLGVRSIMPWLPSSGRWRLG